MNVAEKTAKTAEIDSSRCVGCGACIQNCPVSAIRMMPGWKAAIDAEKCIGCGTCVNLCHKHAPYFIRETA